MVALGNTGYQFEKDIRNFYLKTPLSKSVFKEIGEFNEN